MARAVDTATIRVTRETRDLLAEQARDRGMSLSAMLTELARNVAREAVFRSERQAARADAESREALREERAWESAAGDGVEFAGGLLTETAAAEAFRALRARARVEHGGNTQSLLV